MTLTIISLSSDFDSAIIKISSKGFMIFSAHIKKLGRSYKFSFNVFC